MTWLLAAFTVFAFMLAICGEMRHVKRYRRLIKKWKS